jgi:hypothetical protein
LNAYAAADNGCSVLVRLPSPELGESDDDHLSDVVRKT